jgi:hypothetical protein
LSFCHSVCASRSSRNAAEAGEMKNRREHTRAKNVLSLWNPTGGANAAAWRFGYSVGRRIIHTMLKKKCEIAEKIW